MFKNSRIYPKLKVKSPKTSNFQQINYPTFAEIVPKKPDLAQPLLQILDVSLKFAIVQAPLASMEDLSMANTPMSSLAGTPTAGQSPRMQRSRWSHRSSSGTTLEMVLGPINEEHQEEEEEEEGPETEVGGGQFKHKAPQHQPIATNSQV